MKRTGNVSYSDKRRAIWEANRKDWDMLAEKDLVADLDKSNLLPESRVEDRSLRLALDCLYAGDRKHSEMFCRRAILVADRIVLIDKCRENPICEQGYPRNLGTVLRGQTYAKWLLGEPLDRTQMRDVAQCMCEWCLTKAVDHKRFHDSITMNFYLEGVRAAMIACDLDYAADLLKTKHKFRWHHAIERDLWTRLISAYPDINPALGDEFESFFNRVRDPDFEEKEWKDAAARFIPTFINNEILALETGIIRQMYLFNPSALDPVDPQAVIDAVAH